MTMIKKIGIALMALMVLAAPAAAEKVCTSFLYDEGADCLTARLWLEREGAVLRSTSSDKFGEATIEIYDEMKSAWLPTQTMTPPAADDKDAYLYTWVLEKASANATGVRLGKGKTYFARCTIRYGGPSGTGFTYQTGTTFTLVALQDLRDAATTAATLRTRIADVKDAISGESALTHETVLKKTGGVLVAPEARSPQEDASQAAGTGGTGAAAPPEQVGILIDEKVVLLGSLVTVRFRTYPGVAPVVTVYDSDRVVRVATARMLQEKEGVYKYILRLESSWPEGTYTVVCSEATHGTMDTLTLVVKRPDLATLAGATPTRAAAPEATEAEVQALSAGMEEAEARLAQAASKMLKLQEGTTATTEVAECTSSLYNDLKELGKKMKELGIDPAGLSEVSEEKSGDFAYLRNKTQELRALLEINKRLLEEALQEKPVIQVWMEFR